MADPTGDVDFRRTPSLVSPKHAVRTLVFSTRGVSPRERHLIKDMRQLLPHSKKENKLDEKHKIRGHIKELCAGNRCDSTIFFENRKRKDLYMWLSMVPSGPSVRFHVLNIHTMKELKLTGNCIKGSRPVLHFDAAFESQEHLKPVRALLNRIFGTPRYHALSKPFVDHIFCFFWFDNRIYFRNYQIVDQEISSREVERSLMEIGPRFVLNPIRVFSGCMGGKTVWANKQYITPNKMRSDMKRKRADPEKYHKRKEAQARRKDYAKTGKLFTKKDGVEDVFRKEG